MALPFRRTDNFMLMPGQPLEYVYSALGVGPAPPTHFFRIRAAAPAPVTSITTAGQTYEMPYDAGPRIISNGMPGYRAAGRTYRTTRYY